MFRFYKHLLTILLVCLLSATVCAEDTLTAPQNAAQRKKAIDYIMKVIKEGKDVNARDGQGRTALFLACQHCEIGVVQKILDAGGQLDIADNEGYVALHAAASSGSTEIASVLLGLGADIHAVSETGKTPLYAATLSNQPEMVEYLLKMEADAMQPKQGGWYPIHPAADLGHVDIIKIFLEHGISIDLQSEIKGFTPLCNAANSEQVETCKFLIENGADVNRLSNYHWSPLMYAVQNNNTEIVQLLLDNGADVNEFANGGKNPLLLAVEKKQMVIVKQLLEKGADTTTLDAEGKTVLDYAAKNNHKAMLKLLVDQGADINMVNGEGKTCLLSNAGPFSGNQDMLRPLMFLGAEPKIPPVLDFMDTLSFSAQAGASESVAELRKMGIIADAYKVAIPSFVPTQYITKDTWDKPIVEFTEAFNQFLTNYVKEYNDWQFTDYAGNTFLHWVAENNQPNWVEWAIQQGMDVNVQSVFGRTPLHRAADKQTSTEAAIRVLLEYGADIHAKDIVGNTPLHYAAFRSDQKTAEMLIEKGANINTVNNYGMTPLHYVKFNHATRSAKIIKSMLALGADPTIQDFKGDTILHITSRDFDSFPELLQDIIRKGGHVNQPNKMGQYPLHLAYRHNNLTSILAQQGADLEVRNRNGLTPLCKAIWQKQTSVINTLIEAGADVNAATYTGWTPLHYAAWTDSAEYLQTLIDHNADLQAKTFDDESILDIAKRFKKLKAVTFLEKQSNSMVVETKTESKPVVKTDFNKEKAKQENLEQKRQMKKADDERIRGDWMYSVKEGSLAMAVLESDPNAVRKVVENGADLNEFFVIGNSFHYSAIYMATRFDDEPMVRLLAELGADINLGEKEPSIQSPLHLAAEQNSLRMTKLLVELGADMHITDSSKRTPFVTAALKGAGPVVNFYENKGFDIKMKDEQGGTLLHNGVNQPGSTQFLLQQGLDVNARTNSGVTPLHVAAHTFRNDTSVVKILIQHGANVDIEDKYGNTPLTNALQYDKVDIAKLLIESGANVNKSQKPRVSVQPPIHLAKGNMEIVQLLLDNGADIHTLNRHKENVIHHLVGSSAGGTDDIAVLELYLKKGVDINAKDDDEQTPIFHCVEAERIDLLEFLIENGAEVNVTDQWGQTPLWHAATKNKSSVIVKTLIAHSAETDIRNNDGYTLKEALQQRNLPDMLEVIENAGR